MVYILGEAKWHCSVSQSSLPDFQGFSVNFGKFSSECIKYENMVFLLGSILKSNIIYPTYTESLLSYLVFIQFSSFS